MIGVDVGGYGRWAGLVLVVLLVVGVCMFGVVGVSRAWGEAFGVEGFDGFLSNGVGAPVVASGEHPLAGSHPAALTTTFVFDHRVLGEAVETAGEEPIPVVVETPSTPKSLVVNLPPGVVVDPFATPTRCTEAQLDGNSCPLSSAVGVLHAEVAGFPYRVFGALYNMVAPAGSPGEFGTNLVGLGYVVHIDGKVRAGSYALSAEVSEIIKTYPIFEATATLWGNPSEGAHDSERGPCALEPRTIKEGGGCAVEATETALLTLPGSCTGQPLVMSSVVDSWSQPETLVPAVSAWPAVTGCSGLQFEPTIEVQPERTGTSLPTGAHIDLHLAQNETLASLGAANLRDASVTFPAGMSLNPAAAGGREACSPAQVGLEGPEEKQSIVIERPVTDTFTLALDGHQTEAIEADADAETLQQELERLPGIGAGGVSVAQISGGYEVQLTGPLKGHELPALTGEAADNDFQELDLQATGGTYELEFGGAGTGASVTGNLEAGSEAVSGVVVGAGKPLVGEAVAGQGIAAGTTITAVGVGTLTLSAAAVETVAGAALAASLPFDAHASLVQEALEVLPGLAGNVMVSGGGTNDIYTGERGPLTVAFTGALAGQEVAEEIGVVSSLTGAGAGVTVTSYPPVGVPLAIGVEGAGVRFAEKLENPQTGRMEATVCPQASKVGTVEVTTPLLSHPLPGSVYLAQQEHNPFGSLFAVYLVVDDPQTGVIVKLAGEVEPNETTGQLTTKFVENPQLPVEDVKVDLFGGQRAPLVTPAACGPATTSALLEPWSTSVPTPATSTFDFGESEGGSCAPLGFKPSLTAGTTSAQAGASSTFVMELSRGEHEQYFHQVSITLPPGLLATLKGVPRCGETEANNGSCPASSLLGEADASVGVGEPYWVSGGKIYLTGPYDGDPFGLAIAVPAVAGPFNLGTQVIRAGIQINPTTAQPTVTTSPSEPYEIPAILKVRDPITTQTAGVPTYVHEIRAIINRENFMVNPTNCTAKETTGTITAIPAVNSTTETSVPVTAPYQAANCATLPFKPVLTASTQAKTSKLDGASLTIKVTATPGQANTAKVKLTFPLQLPSRLTTLQKACLAAVFQANPASCPEGSDIGTATVKTPLLAATLEGPIYLVSYGGAKFPDAEIVLQGEGITLTLDGNTDIKNGITTSTFNTVPDAPFTSFETTLPEGPHSAFATYIPEKDKGNMCGQKLTLPTSFTAQNGATQQQQTKITITGCPKTHKKHHHHKKHHNTHTKTKDHKSK